MTINKEERPLLCHHTLVPKIIDLSKTITRRIVKYPALNGEYGWHPSTNGWLWKTGGSLRPVCPYGKVGDLLWVRETHKFTYLSGRQTMNVRYKDTLEDNWKTVSPLKTYQMFKWRPSIHMPRWASRLLLEILEIRVERVQEITDLDIEKEGYNIFGDSQPRAWFSSEWDSINAKRYGWETNPWVFVITFKVVKE